MRRRNRVECNFAEVIRNPSLEALLEERPDDLETSLIYADWLAEHGDPLGEWILHEQRRAVGKRTAHATRERERYFTQHAAYLFGGAGPRRLELIVPENGWTLGLRRHLYLDDPETVKAALGAPVARFLTRLDIRDRSVLRKVALATASRALRVLSIATYEDSDISWIWQRFPRLERLELVGDFTRVGKIEMRHARELLLRVGGAKIAAKVAELTWPALEVLSLHSEQVVPLVDLVRSVGVPSLRRLAISLTSAVDPTPVVEALIAGPVLAALTQLQLSFDTPLAGALANLLVREHEKFAHLSVLTFQVGRRVRMKQLRAMQRLPKHRDDLWVRTLKLD